MKHSKTFPTAFKKANADRLWRKIPLPSKKQLQHLTTYSARK